MISNSFVGRAFHYRGLTVYPLILRRDLDGRSYLSLDDGFGNGSLQVLETGIVAEVAIANRSNIAAFGMAGEILIGGKQNRMLGQDVLIPPQTQVRVPVYCVEKGRWEGDVRQFESKCSLSLPGLRSQAASGASQDAVWGKIAESARTLGCESKTENFQSFYETERVRKEIDDYQKGFRPFWRGAMAGLVICRYGTIVGAEVFGSSNLFSKLQHKILDSYILDCLHYPEVRPFRDVDERDVRNFLDAVHRAQLIYGNTPGEGRSITVSGSANGRALSSGGVVVHLSLFGGASLLSR
ncbi:MAG: hypothetical protein HYU36_20660 [Planctomycetes bacterium]|nr:hypothetical protein [Planctomycetota bacterium]